MWGGNNIRQMRKNRNNIKCAVPTRRKTDSAGWRDASLKPLTYAQDRIKTLCEGFLRGQITSKEFKRELPLILNSRDREKRNMAS